jgi:hypothetical protein
MHGTCPHCHQDLPREPNGLPLDNGVRDNFGATTGVFKLSLASLFRHWNN